MPFRSVALSVLTLSATLAVMVPTRADAVDFSLKIEPGLAIPLSAPQSQVYGVGAGQSVKGLFGLTSFLDIGPMVSVLVLPALAPGAESGVAWGLGGGLRLKRPHDAVSFAGVSPWVDIDLLYVRTGPLNRIGFDVGAGLAFPLGEARNFWLGPFVRYMQVGQPIRSGFDNRDAKVFFVGVSFEVGTGIHRGRKGSASSEACADAYAVNTCADSDIDGIPDNIDSCPEVKGPMDNWGCPNYQRLTVKRDRLELKEKLYFALNEAKLEDASFPVLDDVVQALKENRNFRVQVEGHSDSSGPDDNNQTLSERRAAAVLDYLAAHGIAKERLQSKGFSSTEPRDTNATAAGRENNRRVEFVVYFTIVKDRSTK